MDARTRDSQRKLLGRDVSGAKCTVVSQFAEEAGTVVGPDCDPVDAGLVAVLVALLRVVVGHI